MLPEAAALEVYAPGEAGFDPGLSASLARVPGVRTALPTVQATGGMPSWYSSAAVIVRGNRPRDGEPEPQNDEAFVPAELAETHGLKSGGQLRLWGTTECADLTIATVFPTTGRPGAGGYVVVSLATARRLFGLGEQVNLVRVELDDSADLVTVKNAIATSLSPGLAVREPAGRADITRGLRAASARGLTGLTAAALAGAGYIVFGLAQLNLLARRPELAILRTLGASTRQIEGILLRHSLLLGCCGGCWAPRAGWHSRWASWAARVQQWDTPSQRRALAGKAQASESVSASVSRSVPSGSQPGRCAATRYSLSCERAWRALACSDPVFGQRPSRRCFSPWASGYWPTARRVESHRLGGEHSSRRAAATLAGMTGVVAPRLPWMLARLEPSAQALFGVESVIAIRQLGRRPEHTARTGGVVFVTVTMGVGFWHTVLNTLADVRAWTDRAIPAHLLVRGAPPDPGFVLNVPLPESVGDELRSLGGVACVEQITFIPTTVSGSPALVLARTFAPDQPLPLDLRGADGATVRQGLANGEAVLAEGLATSLRVRAGDSVAIDTPRGPQTLRVAGVVTEYAAGGRAACTSTGIPPLHSSVRAGFMYSCSPHAPTSRALPKRKSRGTARRGVVSSAEPRTPKDG